MAQCVADGEGQHSQAADNMYNFLSAPSSVDYAPNEVRLYPECTSTRCTARQDSGEPREECTDCTDCTDSDERTGLITRPPCRHTHSKGNITDTDHSEQRVEGGEQRTEGREQRSEVGDEQSGNRRGQEKGEGGCVSVTRSEGFSTDMDADLKTTGIADIESVGDNTTVSAYSTNTTDDVIFGNKFNNSTDYNASNSTRATAGSPSAGAALRHANTNIGTDMSLTVTHSENDSNTAMAQNGPNTENGMTHGHNDCGTDNDNGMARSRTDCNIVTDNGMAHGHNDCDTVTDNGMTHSHNNCDTVTDNGITHRRSDCDIVTDNNMAQDLGEHDVDNGSAHGHDEHDTDSADIAQNQHDLTGPHRRRRMARLERRQEAGPATQPVRRLTLPASLMARWRAVGRQWGVQDDDDIARILTRHYEDMMAGRPPRPPPRPRCEGCGEVLVPLPCGTCGPHRHSVRLSHDSGQGGDREGKGGFCGRCRD